MAAGNLARSARRLRVSALAAVLILACAAPAKSAGAGAAFEWKEAYAGVFAGAGWAINRLVDVDGFANWGNPGSALGYSRLGAVGGALAGQRFAFGRLGFRVEAEAIVGGLPAVTRRLDPGCTDEAAMSRFRWVASVRLGIEEEFGGVLVFASGGPALARIVNSVTDTDYSGTECLERDLRFDADDSFSSASTRVGWAIGAGVETPLAPRWALRVDGSYFEFGKRRYRVNLSGNNTCGPGGPNTACSYIVRNRLGILRLALVYRFDE